MPIAAMGLPDISRPTVAAKAPVLIVIAVGLYAVAPSKAGQVLGVAVALVLLPVPLVVAYFSRRRALRRTSVERSK